MRCEMLKSTPNKCTCDPSGMWGCPKAIRRDMITPECWRLRRFVSKEASPEKKRVTRETLVKCPRCKTTFKAGAGV
jgi:hypothetical protein